MPVGPFLSSLNPDTRAGGSLTGPSPSQPKSSGLADVNDPRFDFGYGPGAATAGGSGYTAGQQRGSNQFPGGQGPSATMPGSISQYPVSIYGTAPQTSPLSSITGLVNTLFGPQQTLLGQQLARQYDQLGLIGANADYQTSALKRDNALASQLLGLDRQALGIDRNLTNTQLRNLGRLRGLLGAERGLASETKSNQLRSIGISEAQAKDEAQRKIFDLRSDLTARGAFNTVANERGTGRINRDLVYNLGQLGTQRTGADISYRNALLGIDKEGISYDNQQAGLQAKLANIGLDASRLGISQQQLENSLADGLHQIGLGSMTSINSLLDAIGGTNTQQAALAGQILQSVIGYSNLPPDVIAQLNAMLGLGATSNTSGSRNNTTGTSGGTRTGGNYGS